VENVREGSNLSNELLGIAASVFSVSVFLPQIVKMIINRASHNVSVGMFVVSLIGNTLWASYGYRVSDFPVMISSLIMGILASIAIVIAIKFKKKANMSKISNELKK
jgi:MtN3 and saliva related transmembrane protein